MKIKSISAKNFAGSNFDFDFGAVTLIVGPNFAGKTKITTAVRLALCGYLPPPIGTKGVYRLAGNPDQPGEMSLHLDLDQNRNVDWKWTRDAKGKISVEGGVPPDLVMPPLLLEPRSFFALTGAKRVATIFASCPEAAKIGGRIKARLNEIQVMPAKVRAAVLEDVMGWMLTCQSSEQLLDRTKTEAESAADAMKLAGGKVQGFNLPAGKPADVSKELDKARNDLAELKVGMAVNRKQQEQKLARDNAALEAYSRRYQNIPVAELLGFIGNELETIKKDFGWIAPTPPIDDILEELEEAKNLQAAAAQGVDKFMQTVQNLDKLIGDIEIATCCPTCLAKNAGWKARVLSVYTKSKSDFQIELSKFVSAKEQYNATVTRLTAAMTDTQTKTRQNSERRQELTDTKARLEFDLTAIMDAIKDREELQAAMGAEPVADTATEEKRTILTNQIALLQSQEAARAAYDRDMAKREELEAELVTQTARADVLKAVVKIVVEEQRKATETAFGTVLATARHFTDGMLNSPLEFVDGDLGRRVSELDRQRPGFMAPLGSWITHECFSDSEQRIAYVAFAMALASTAPVKLVIVDELATLQSDRKVMFIDRLLQLTRKGIIDQAICLEPSGADYAGFENVPEIKMLKL
jgi:hypothetical protein